MNDNEKDIRHLSQIQDELQKGLNIPQILDSLLKKTNINIIKVRVLTFIDGEKYNSIEKQQVEIVFCTKENPYLRITAVFDGIDLFELRAFLMKFAQYTTNLCFPMKNVEFNKFRNFLHQIAEKKTIYNNPGHNGNVYVFSNQIIEYNKPLSNNYKAEDNKDYNLPENSYIKEFNICKPILYLPEKFNKSIVKNFFLVLVKSYKNSAALICFGGILAIVFWDIFIKIAQGFAPVILFGEAQSGKSNMLIAASSIFGISDLSNQTSGNSTMYALLSCLGTRNNFPLFIDEIDKAIFPKVEQLIKNCYNALNRIRGKKDGLDMQVIKTSFVATSNSFFPDINEQIISRLLFVNMKKDDFVRENYTYFSYKSRKELSQILPYLLCYRNKIPEYYNNSLKRLQTLLSNENERCISNIAISVTMWTIINEIIDENIVNINKMASNYYEMYQDYLNTETLSSDIIMNDINKMITDDAIDCGQEYMLVKEHFIRLNLNRYLEKFNMLNPNRILKPNKFRLLVQSDKRFDTHTVPRNDIGRAILINISNEEGLLSAVKERFEKYKQIQEFENVRQENIKKADEEKSSAKDKAFIDEILSKNPINVENLIGEITGNLPNKDSEYV